MDGLGQAGHVFGVDARHGDAAVASEVDAVPAGQGVHLQQGGQAAAGKQQRQLDCDILVTGHTHTFSAYEAEGKLFINPGSATGAFSPSFKLTEEPTPSFVLMDVQQQRVVIYVYELVGEEVKVKKIEHTKAAAAA